MNLFLAVTAWVVPHKLLGLFLNPLERSSCSQCLVISYPPTRSDDEVSEVASSQSTMLMASPEVIKAMKDFDGHGNIALLPLFASDFIHPNSVVLNDSTDVEPWLQIRKKNRIRSRASQARLDELVHDLAVSLRRKFRDILEVSSFPVGAEPSSSEVEALVHLWDAESLSRLYKLWDASYSLAALRLIASFFDRPGGPAPSAADLAARSKRELCEYIVSLGMMYMSPDFADGLVHELLERRYASGLAPSQDQNLAVDGIRVEPVSSSDTNFMSYQLAFIKAVLFPEELFVFKLCLIV